MHGDVARHVELRRMRRLETLRVVFLHVREPALVAVLAVHRGVAVESRRAEHVRERDIVARGLLDGIHEQRPHAKADRDRREGEEQHDADDRKRRERRADLTRQLSGRESVQAAEVEPVRALDQGKHDGGARPEQQEGADNHEERGGAELVVELLELVVPQKPVRHRQHGQGEHEADDARPQRDPRRDLGLGVLREQVAHLAARHEHDVHDERRGKQDRKADEGLHERARAHDERVVRHRGAHERGGGKRERLREHETHHQAGDERDRPHHEHLNREHAGDPRGAHAEQQIGPELALATLDDEAVGVGHQKGEHDGDRHREQADEVVGHLEDATDRVLLDVEQHGLRVDGVERVKHGDAEQQRHEVDGVIARAAAHVAHGEPSEHGAPPLPAGPGPRGCASETPCRHLRRARAP